MRNAFECKSLNNYQVIGWSARVQLKFIWVRERCLRSVSVNSKRKNILYKLYNIAIYNENVERNSIKFIIQHGRYQTLFFLGNYTENYISTVKNYRKKWKRNLKLDVTENVSLFKFVTYKNFKYENYDSIRLIKIRYENASEEISV